MSTKAVANGLARGVGGALVVGLLAACSANATPDESDAKRESALYSAPRYIHQAPVTCWWVNANATVASFTPNAEEQALLNLGCDTWNTGVEFTVPETPGGSGHEERFSLCPATASVAAWVNAHVDGPGAYGAHENPYVCDAYLPFPPAGWVYVLWDLEEVIPQCRGYCPSQSDGTTW
jgi:hypothetical protein